MKRDLIKYTFVTIIIVSIFIFGYPTLYKYDKLDQKYPVKINRITGKTQILSGAGWEVVGLLASPDVIPSSPESIIPSPTSKLKRGKGSAQILTNKTTSVEIGKFSFKKIYFSGRSVTGEITNISDSTIQLSSVIFNTYDTNENVLENQPNVFGPPKILGPNETIIYTIYLNAESSAVGKFNINISFVTGL